MRRTASLVVAAATALLVLAVAAPAKPRRAAPKVAVQAVPKPHNEFVTVHEFQVGKRAPGTLVSVEGYFVTGYAVGTGAVRLHLTDSVDHVLSTEDALLFEQHAAPVIVPAARVGKSGPRAWNRRGMMRYVMYTGKGRPQIPLHDVIEKVRVTGTVGSGRACLSSVGCIEYMDMNGFWKKL